MKRFFLLALLFAASLRAQTPIVLAPCDTAGALVKSTNVYTVGRSRYTDTSRVRVSCPTFAHTVDSVAKANPGWTLAQFTQTLLSGAPAIVVAPPKDTTPPPNPPPASGLYPNRPASFTKSTQIDFSQAIPSQPDNVDRPIAGTNWSMIYFGSNWSTASDPTAPQSSPGVWQGRWSPGSYGGGVIGAGSGHGIGNVFTYALNPSTRVYISLRVYFDFDASQWHPISNKFLNLETNAGLLLVQLNEGGQWRHAEELSSPGFWVDNRTVPGEAHIAGQVDNRPVPTRKWVQLEVLIDLPGKVFKVWQDGVLTTDAKPTFAASTIYMVGVYAFRGGGGETLTTDLFYRYDHFFLAW